MKSDQGQRRPQTRYNRELVEKFLCQHHGVEGPWKIVPFGRMKEAWEVMRPVTLTVEARLEGVRYDIRNPNPEAQAIRCTVGTEQCKMMCSPEPPATQRFKHPATKMPMALDFDRVCPYSVVTRHVRSDLDVPVVVRLNFYHQGLNVLEKQEEHDDLLALGGSIKGAYMSVERTPPFGKDVELHALKRREFSYCNEFFAATMALINNDNLRNGLVVLPPDLCLAAGLPIWRGAPEPPEDVLLAGAFSGLSMSAGDQQRAAQEAREEFQAKWLAKTANQKRVSYFVAVPINHVLAWGLHSEDYCVQHGVRREEFFFSPPLEAAKAAGMPRPDDILLYYLVPDVTLEAMIVNFKERWMGRVDVRPLSSVAFDVVPLTGARRYPGVAPEVTHVTGNVLVRSTISYMVAPVLTAAQIANLAPALSPTFTSCHQWDPVQAQREREIVDKYQ